MARQVDELAARRQLKGTVTIRIGPPGRGHVEQVDLAPEQARDPLSMLLARARKRPKRFT